MFWRQATFAPLGLSSPQLRFTAVFGMRTGGATAPNHQNARFNILLQVSNEQCRCTSPFWEDITSDLQSSRQDRRISTSRLNTLRRVHLKPINVIISYGSTISNLGAGFPLICFQRLSNPNIATWQCHWRDNQNTRGSFIPVLSY